MAKHKSDDLDELDTLPTVEETSSDETSTTVPQDTVESPLDQAQTEENTPSNPEDELMPGEVLETPKVEPKKASTDADDVVHPGQVIKDVPAEARWYVVHTYSGHENRVAAAVRQRVDAMNVSGRIFNIFVPTRDTVTVKRGKKEDIKEKIFPGYILVQMILDDDSWLVVRTTPGVTSFVGMGNRPTPLSEKEVDAIMRFSELAAPKFKAAFTSGEAVKIIEGPFADFIGSVDSIDDARGKVKVLVSIFGRETPVELDFLQVSKL